MKIELVEDKEAETALMPSGIPADTWGEVDDLGTHKDRHSDMEEILREKYQPKSLWSLSDGYQERKHGETRQRADVEAEDKHPSSVILCIACGGHGKITQTFALSELGAEGTCRVVESCCQKCMGMGVIEPAVRNRDEEVPIRRTAEQCVGRLDNQDPKVDIEKILAAAGPSPFVRKKDNDRA